jgi:hypothetical protein
VRWGAPWPMRGLLTGSLLAALSGCMTLKLEVEQVPTPDVVRWQREVTARVNDHEKRLEALEVENGGADQTAR